jgi:hypothetical protein
VSESKSIKIPVYLRNKFIIAGAAFVVWLAFLDRNNLLSQFQLQSEVNKLESQKEFFRTKGITLKPRKTGEICPGTISDEKR